MPPAYRHCVGTLAALPAPLAALLARLAALPARLAALLALLAALALAGCGGYSKSHFVARADAICASALRQLRSIPPPSFGQSAAQQRVALAGYLAAVVPVLQSQSSELHALPRPAQGAGSRAALTRWLAALDQAVRDYGRLQAAAQHGDAQGVADSEATLRASPVASLAAGYGLSACATPSATIT